MERVGVLHVQIDHAGQEIEEVGPNFDLIFEVWCSGDDLVDDRLHDVTLVGAGNRHVSGQLYTLEHVKVFKPSAEVLNEDVMQVGVKERVVFVLLEAQGCVDEHPSLRFDDLLNQRRLLGDLLQER